MIYRNEYVEKLISLKDKDLIKVVTGIRRCGKSTLFNLYQTHLLESGVQEDQIQSINFEDLKFAELCDYKALYQHILQNINPNKMNYIFLDEIQNVPHYQKAVDSLYIQKNIDVYITGSNAFILAGELATLLSGRYIEIKMMPLSFSEYCQVQENIPNSQLYKSYITNSSFPYTLSLDNNMQNIRDYLEGIYNTIIVKDIADRKNLIDTAQLKRVIRFLANNIGSLVSIKKIADTMTSDGQKISTHTVDDYLQSLIESYVFYPATRYDIKGKEFLKTGGKYYIADLGLRYFLLATKKQDYGYILENIIYLELLRRGYQVYIGKVDSLEVDFVAIKGATVEYYQVALTVLDEKTLERELLSLEKINNHNPKFLLTMDTLPHTNHNGIMQIYALEWLLSKE